MLQFELSPQQKELQASPPADIRQKEQVCENIC